MERKTYLAFRYVRPILAMLVVSGALGFLFMIAMKKIPAGNESSVNTAQGYILSVLSMVIGYYFGTSKDKSDYEQQQRTPNTSTTTTVTQEETKL